MITSIPILRMMPVRAYPGVHDNSAGDPPGLGRSEGSGTTRSRGPGRSGFGRALGDAASKEPERQCCGDNLGEERDAGQVVECLDRADHPHDLAMAHEGQAHRHG